MFAVFKELHRLAAAKPADGLHLFGQATLHGGTHHVEVFLHFGDDLLPRLIGELFFPSDHRLVDRNIVFQTIAAQGFAVFKRIGQ
ncbi:hypothetical protein SDC9_164778 [bioreactor metagenome]|uniref:Uncharacterized protein n=1 Tax=bioreactor metagenome TaxID=1076179 RepID=A0A645FSJ2_9ZZZZ